MTGRDRYAPEPVPPRAPYDANEQVELAEVARLCGRAVEWVESRLASGLPGVLTRLSDGHQWIRRGDVPEWVRAAEAEDVQHRQGTPAPQEAYVKLPPLKVGGYVKSVEYSEWIGS